LSEHVHGDFFEAEAGFLGDEGGAGGDGDVGVVVLAEYWGGIGVVARKRLDVFSESTFIS